MENFEDFARNNPTDAVVELSKHLASNDAALLALIARMDALEQALAPAPAPAA